MRVEFYPFRFGMPFWNRPFPAIEIKDSKPEFRQYGRGKVAKVDNFPEIKDRTGALLKWRVLDKKGAKMIVDIGKNQGYVEGVDVQIIKMVPSTPEDISYYARPMKKGNDLWGEKELSLLKSPPKELSRAYIFENL